MEAFNTQFGKIVEKAWADEAFKKRLEAHPIEVLKEHGIDVPAGLDIKVVENTADVRYFVLPVAPRGELSENDLDKVAGGTSGFPDQDRIGAQGAGGIDNGGTLFAPPTNTDFSTASGLGVSGSGFKIGNQ